MTEEPADPRGGGADPRVADVSQARLYSHLITRQTGRAVRLGIEERLAGGRDIPLVTVLDFRDVTIIDFSCADEVAAKLAGSAVSGDPGLFLLFTGMEDHHLDPVQSALRRRELAVAGERRDGTAVVLGELDSRVTRAWRWVHGVGDVRPPQLARELGTDDGDALRILRSLHRKRLLLHRGERFLSLRHAVSRVGPGDTMKHPRVDGV